MNAITFVIMICWSGQPYGTGCETFRAEAPTCEAGHQAATVDAMAWARKHQDDPGYKASRFTLHKACVHG